MKSSVKAVLILLGLCLAVGGGYLLGTGGHDHGPVIPEAGQVATKVQYTCSMHPFIIRDAPGACPICGMALTPIRADKGSGPAGGQKWRSPMDPTFVRDAPGKDAMGHDLVPVQDQGEGGGVIRIDPITLQSMGVRTERAGKRTLERTVRAVGLVTAADDRQYAVNTKIEGWVERLHVNQLGQQVKKGQPLLEIYSPELVATQEEYLLALKNRGRLAASPHHPIAEGAGQLLAAARARLRYLDISPDQIRALERNGRVSKTLTLASEHGGIVTSKKVLAGARVMAGEELFQIADLSTVWINADLYEYEIPWVRKGQAATVELAAAGGGAIAGTITYISPYLEAETRTVKARVEVANPGLLLKPAMYATVSIATGGVADTLAIPLSAILRSGKGETVFVDLGGGRFAPRAVRSGVRDDGGYVQILSGLTEGEPVVVSAQFMLDSESKLREALDKMLGAQTGPPVPTGQMAPPVPAPAGTPPPLDDLFQ